jgi:PAS domain S-box-containing protein
MTSKLLLVDDEEDIREILGMFLADMGYEVQTAENGRQALELFEQDTFPIVMSDIKMPVMDGIDLLRAIKDTRPDTEVIMVTGHGDMDLAIKSLKLEATDFITKPINEAALEIALKRATERIEMRRQLREHTENLERLVAEKSARLVEIERQLAVGQAVESLSAAIRDLAGGIEGGLRYFNEMPCFVSIHNRQLEVVEANALFRERLGEKIGAGSWEIYHDRAEDRQGCPVAETFRSGAGQRVKKTVICTDGSRVPVMVHTAPIRDRDGNLDLVLEISVDISEVQRLREALRTSQQRFQQLFDEVPCYISVRDADFRLTAANRRFKEAFDYPEGSQCFSDVRGNSAPCRGCPVKETFKDADSHQAEMVVAAKNGTVQNLLVWTAPIRGADGAVEQVMLMATDITEIRRLQDRLSSLGLMMGSLSHAIKGHLTGLDSGMYLLSRGFAENNSGQIHEGWEVVQLIVGRLKKLVLDILYYAKERELKAETTDAARFVDDVLRTLEPKAREHGIELVAEFDESIGEIEIDTGGMRSALLSILENAAEACSEDAGKEAHRIVFRIEAEKDGVRFVVEDNGVGMDRQALESVFTLFFSSKGDRGTGLGLFVAHKVIQKHGGRIEAESRLGQGSRFTIHLPRKLSKSAAEDSEPVEERKMLYCA